MSEAAYRELCRECFESLDRVDPALDPAIEGAFELFGETCFELARDVLLNSDPSERPQRAREIGSCKRVLPARVLCCAYVFVVES